MGKIADALALILACTTANDASVNYSRYVPGCRSRYLEIPHCPDGKNADVLALILACITVTDASMNYSKYVPQRPRKFPSPPWETHVLLVFYRAAVSISIPAVSQ